MSKMKHLLRKLHIGGGSGGGALTEHHHHHHNHRPIGRDNTEGIAAATATPRQLEQQVSTSAVSTQTTALESLESSNSSISSNGNATANAADFSFLEEEFQVQLALAISASDPDSREDPETTAQITAAKQISLGCSPSQLLVDFLSLRYWSYNVIHYDEKVVDGFYDVYANNSSDSVAPGKMPMLVDLESVPITEKVDYEVILVNRMRDMELRKLEEKAHLISTECRASTTGPIMNVLVQKIADIVVDTMGGSVNDADEVMRKWEVRSYELRISLNTMILPLGCLDVGLSRHRALLFKVLADRISLPCMLVKGSYYTGTDDGAVSLIKFGNGSEYIIDLMGAPGTLIPSEVPSSQLQDIRNVVPVGDTVINSCSGFGGGAGAVLSVPYMNEAAKSGISTPEPSFAGLKLDGSGQIASEETQRKLFEADFGNILPSLVRVPAESSEAEHVASTAQQIQVEDVSNCIVSAASNPDFAQKLHAILLENSMSQLPDNSPNINRHNGGDFEVLPRNQLLEEERTVDAHHYPLMCLSHSEQALIPFAGAQLFNNDSNSRGTEISVQGVLQKQGTISSVSNPGNKSASSATNNEFVLVDRGTEYRVLPEDVSKRIKVVGCGEPNPIRDEQIDPLLGGVAEWEIPWEDLQIGERIGIGSYGEVYRAEWNGTEVAAKKFMNQDISGDALAQFKCEVEIMLRLRHPNLVLFMGAVTRPPNLSILTEFLPRGSLFKLLHRSSVQIDEKRRLRMALDVAKGMNYLHTSHPVIVHRDLKTPNLLVDKNWVVKVCDFGMSRLKHHTFLSSKSTAGTAEWMAPEVLRNEPCNEKSDVYSFGVILWELATLDIPWTGMNSMQVVGAVGFQGRRLNIPDRVDPVVAEIITDCWVSNPDRRPSFGEIIVRLKCLQRLVQKTDAPKDRHQS